ncbi:MAG TPA: FAD-dependent oxidoreductase [Streptosporangiaceae bacterium]|nr:FAD-dependent oxidoreductase [Streptosporangiaceae bacterium]
MTETEDRRPVVLAVDDDPQVLRAIRRDLRRSYSGRYRIVTVASAAEALDVLDDLVGRKDEPALLLSDQRMPETNGVEFLRRSLALFPDARRVLLTAYADTDAAIAAINEARLDHYLMKPWDPPEELLYPVLDDLLEDWQAARPAKYQGITVIGLKFNAATHDVRDFLTRQLVPFRYRDADASVDLALPIVEFPDGTVLAAPSQPELAAKLGLSTTAERQAYDLVIIGAGPSGLAAAVYGASEGLSTIAVEQEAPGGQAGTSSRIENYLGFPSGLSGGQLASRATQQAKRLGAEILTPQEVVSMRLEDSVKVLTLADGTEITAQALILATGVSYNRLDVPGAAEHEGAGLYYGAALTEAKSCDGQTVFIVGGANSAGQAAVFFADHAARVVMLIRGGSLEKSMSQYLIEQIAATPNISVRTGTSVVALEGDRRLERLRLRSDGTESVVDADAVFTFIGAAPRTDWLPPELIRDERGFVCTGADLTADLLTAAGWPLSRPPFLLETSLPGVFAVGDVRAGAMRRVASAVGEGAMAVAFTHQYLAGR